MNPGGRAVAATSVLHFLAHFAVLTHAALVLVLPERLGVSPAEVGEAGALGYFLFGALALVSGILVDLWGSRPVLVATGLGVAAGAWTLAGATDLAGVLGGFAVLGAGAGLYHPSGLALLARRVPEGARPRAMATHGVAGNLGIGLAPFVAFLGVERLGSGPFFTGLAVVAALGAALVLAVPRDPPRRKRKREVLANFWGDTRPGYPTLLAWQVVIGTFYRMLITYLPAVLAGALPVAAAGAVWGMPMDRFAGSLVASLVLGAGVAFQITAGRLARPGRLAAQTSVLFLGLAGLALLALAPAPWGLFALGAMGAAVFGHQPLSNSLLPAFVGEDHRGIGYGVQFLATFGAGAVGVTIGARLLGDDLGATGPWLWGLAGLAALGGFLMRALAPREPRPA